VFKLLQVKKTNYWKACSNYLTRILRTRTMFSSSVLPVELQAAGLQQPLIVTSSARAAVAAASVSARNLWMGWLPDQHQRCADFFFFWANSCQSVAILMTCRQMSLSLEPSSRQCELQSPGTGCLRQPFWAKLVSSSQRVDGARQLRCGGDLLLGLYELGGRRI